MADALTNISTFINSPPGQFAGGTVLAGVVWKCFERLENVATEDTKLQVAIWLLDRPKVSPILQSWPRTLLDTFEQVFGSEYYSWFCFWRSSAITLIIAAVGYVLSGAVNGLAAFHIDTIPATVLALFCVCITGFLGLGLTRTMLTNIAGGPVVLQLVMAVSGTLLLVIAYSVVWAVTLVLFSFAVALLGLWSAFQNFFLHGAELIRDEPLAVVLPSFFAALWLWLYVTSGFILKFARRFDIGFAWFNRKFDIEKKPLQSIGLIAGALVAVIYWTTALISRFWH